MPVLGVMIERMSKTLSKRLIAALFLACIMSLASFGQQVGSVTYNSQEISEIDGIPVLIKHLPEWESVRERTTLAKSVGELKTALGDRPILDLIDFSAGTEAVAAQYDAGKLLIIEYTSPQGSVDADTKFTDAIAESGDATIYRRIGNYNVLVFDAKNKSAANELIDQVKYEKHIQWLGNNPFAISAERAFILTTADVFFSTLMVIVGGIVFSIFGGIVIGYLFYHFRDGRRSKLTTYNDAGGMTRLNLDGFTPDILPERLLKD